MSEVRVFTIGFTRTTAREFFGKLTKLSREDNAKSLDLIKEAGIQIHQLANPGKIQNFFDSGKKARQELAGDLYDQELLERVETSLNDFRTKASN